MNPHDNNANLWLAMVLLAAATVAYLPSFTAWFFLDDFRIILENEALQNVFDPAAVWRFSEPRFIASLTLAANYTLHGDSVFGYHLVNFVIHVIAGLSLWLLLRALLRSPALSDAPEWTRWVPWIALAIFLLHPLQTQAVTYIVQRYTSLMAMFYLASLAAFAWARIRGSAPMFIASLALAALALLSKQTAVTLPLAIVLVELVFFRRPSPRAWAAIVAGTALLAVAAAWLLTLPAFDIVGLTRETGKIARIDYLATQMEVLWRYIGLFFFIGEQRLEYDIAIADGFSGGLTVLMTLGHVALLGLGLALWQRRPLIALGIVFYYLAHVIESSFLPIIDVAFEHRTYLPNAGLAIAVAVGLAWLVHAVPRFRAGAAFTLALCVLLTATSYARNALWADQIEFLRHETELSPGSQRAWTSLGKELMRDTQFEEALRALENARRIGMTKDDGELRPPTLLNMIFALHYTERNEEAVALADRIEIDNLNDTETAYYFEARGRALYGLGRYEEARADLLRAARINPSPAVVTFLAATELQLGNRAQARRLAGQVLEVDPDNRLAREIYERAK
ncbi:MAG: tetratricopeptide repeat protein [Wenzhouxiangellaceae bacterium]|nr:tetratricopeptide repeat protein [Wenzhouxiangellaceae bacterium]